MYANCKTKKTRNDCLFTRYVKKLCDFSHQLTFYHNLYNNETIVSSSVWNFDSLVLHIYYQCTIGVTHFLIYCDSWTAKTRKITNNFIFKIFKIRISYCSTFYTKNARLTQVKTVDLWRDHLIWTPRVRSISQIYLYMWFTVKHNKGHPVIIRIVTRWPVFVHNKITLL